jgi:uncharacterized protein YbjT (DUF2867 family)
VILVTGATGNIGRHVVSELVEAGVPVRALTRGETVPGAEVVHGDLSVPNALDACLDGVDGVFLIWPLFTADAAPGVVAARARQPRRIVYQSTVAVRDDVAVQRHPYSAFHATIEDLLQRSDAEWTVLRAGKFATNTLGWAPEIRTGGVVRFPFGAARRSPIHERDVAAVAAGVLTGAGHGGRSYVVTGPESLTEADQVRMI